MTFRELSPTEMKEVRVIFDDLKLLFNKENIAASEIPEVIAELKSSEAKTYLENLHGRSKPETALSDAFFGGQSLLLRYFATDKVPEVKTDGGFIDFKIFSGNRFIKLELKPLFDKETRDSQSGKEIVNLKQKKLDWKDHSIQIQKYLKQDGEYVVITDLKNWYFFDESVSYGKFEPFYETDLEGLEKKFSEVENFYSLVERSKYDSIHEELDTEFFKDLKVWINKLRTVDFDCNDDKKLKLVIGMINKFIFIQTLHDHKIIEFQWIQKRWKNYEELWLNRKFELVNQFFDTMIKWFFNSYDTELFSTNEIDLLKKDEANVTKFYNILKMVLGFSYTESRGQRGILQYKFNFIDEDVFGKAYESYLAEERHDKGIYYTPSYITQFIVENTVGKIFRKKIDEIKKNLELEKYALAEKHLIELTELKVIDPSCGSGSFLIKAFRIIWHQYLDLSDTINQTVKKHDVYDTLTRDEKVEEKANSILKLKKILGFETRRELVSKLILRHIHGNDIDQNAVSTTKVNLWLEAIKLSPKDFAYEKLPADTNRILPFLDINITVGDAVIGLPDDFVVDFLEKNHSKELSKMTQLRLEYIENSTKEGLIEEIVKVKKNLNEEISKEFVKSLEKKKLPPSLANSLSPFYWPIDFWYFYFKDSKPLPTSERGANIVIGNPPYVSKASMKIRSTDIVDYLNETDFESTISGGSYDLAVIFIERGFNLLKKGGEFSYIVTNKFFLTDYGEGIRKFISDKKSVREIIDFADQQVFKQEATTYTSIIFLNNSKNDTFKYLRTKRLLETQEQLEINSESYTKDTKVFFVNNSDLTSDGWCFLNDLDKEIVNRTKSFKKLSDDNITERIFQGLNTGSDPVFILNLIKEENGLVRAFSKSLDREIVLEKELTRPLLKGADIKKWNVPNYDDIIIFPYVIKGDNAELIEEKTLKTKFPKIYEYFLETKDTLGKRDRGKWKGVKNWYAFSRSTNIARFDQNKILIQVLADNATFALDKGFNYYFVGGGTAGGYAISLPKNSKISLDCLIPLLNSSYLDWRHHQCATRFDNGFYAYGQMYIENLPIVSFEKKSKVVSDLEELVQNILKYKNELIKFREIWKYWSDQMNDVEKSVKDILVSEEANIKEGDLKNIWFEKFSFFISKNQELMDKEFNSFKLSGDFNKSSVAIFGIKNHQDQLIFELVLKDKLLANHFYLCLDMVINSRQKTKTLTELFEKTFIPILQPNASKKTLVLMEKVLDEYSKVSQNKIAILEMEDEIEDMEAKIDSIVFNEYGVKEDEINYIIDELMLDERYREKIIKHFNELKK